MRERDKSRGDYSSSLHKKLREARFLNRVRNKEGKCSQHRKQSESLIPDDASGRRINHGLRSTNKPFGLCVCVMLCKYFVACHWAGKCARGMSHRRSCAARGGREGGGGSAHTGVARLHFQSAGVRFDVPSEWTRGGGGLMDFLLPSPYVYIYLNLFRAIKQNVSSGRCFDPFN